jgi:hypothetical protein
MAAHSEHAPISAVLSLDDKVQRWKNLLTEVMLT